MIEVSLDTYAVGEGGKVGVCGRLVSKQGQVLARAMQSGFLEAFARAFQRQPVAVVDTNPGNRARFQSNLTPEALVSAALSGVGSALDRLTQFYLDLAEDMFPVIEVDADRRIDFVVHRGIHLDGR